MLRRPLDLFGGCAMETVLPCPQPRLAIGERRRALVGDIVRYSRERVDRRDMWPHRHRQQAGRHRKIFVMRSRQRLARAVRARERLGPVWHRGILRRKNSVMTDPIASPRRTPRQPGTDRLEHWLRVAKAEAHKISTTEDTHKAHG